MQLTLIAGAFLALALFFIHLTPSAAATIFDAQTYLQTANLPHLYTQSALFIDKGYPLFLHLLQLVNPPLIILQLANYALWAGASYFVYAALRTRNSPQAKLAGILMLFSPLYLTFSAKIYSEPLAAFGFALGIFALNQLLSRYSLLHSFLFFFSVVIVVLTKSVFLPLILILFPLLIFIRRYIPLLWLFAALLLAAPGITSSLGGSRSLYNLAIQSAKLSLTSTEILQCFPYSLSVPLGQAIFPQSANLCHQNDPDPSLPGYNRNPYVVASQLRQDNFSYRTWLNRLFTMPGKYLLVLLTSLGNIVFVEGVYPSILLQFPFTLQVVFMLYKIVLSLWLWVRAFSRRTLWLLIPLTYFFLVVGNFPVEPRYFYPLLPFLYFAAFIPPRASDPRPQLKVLQVSTWLDGGAGIMASQLSHVLASFGVQSTLYTAQNRGKLAFFAAKITAYADAIFSKFHSSTNPIFRSYNFFPNLRAQSLAHSSFSLIHLHWIGAGFISLFDLASIQQPIVWTLHDLWPVLGAEHMPGTDSRYLDSNSSARPFSDHGPDLSQLVWRLKHWSFSHLNLTFVAPSTYIYQQFKRSGLGRNYSIVLIPNGIDTRFFAPPRSSLHSPRERRLFFAAANAEVDHNKGLDLLAGGLNQLSPSRHYSLSLNLAGLNHLPTSVTFPSWIKVRCLGSLTRAQMRRQYRQSDLVVVPSRRESFSLVTLEAMACGTPVVAFRTGGIPDLIQHLSSGYLAKPFQVTDFARGISVLLSSSRKLSIFSRRARRQALRFDQRLMAQRYLQLYRQILSISPNGTDTHS